jgi:hypothetical protein
MFQEVKQVVAFLHANHAAKFSVVFAKVDIKISAVDQKRIKALLISDNIVTEGETFGTEPDYSLTDDGRTFLNAMIDCEILDKILHYLDKNDRSYYDMESICQQCDVPFSRIYGIKLENEGHIENSARSNDGDGFGITKLGRYFIHVEGGYCKKLKLEIEQLLMEKKQSEGQSVKYEITSENVIFNQNSSISNQTQSTSSGMKSDKKNWLQTIYWIVGIVLSALTIYGVVSGYFNK